MKITVHVMLKPSVFDPQGGAVKKAIHGLGMENVKSARIGKIIELEVEGKDDAQTRAKLEEICRDLLSNPVIETYQIQWP